MRIKTILAINSIILLNICLILQQANYYQMFEFSNIYRNTCLIMVAVSVVLIIISKSGKVFLIPSQKSAIALFAYMILIGIIYGDSFARIYWAVIDLVLFALISISFREIPETKTEKIIVMENLFFWVSAVLYFYAKLNSSFYTSGEHSSPMFPFMLLPFCGMNKKKKYLYLSLLCMLLIAFFESARSMFLMTCIMVLYNLLADYGKGHGIKGYLLIFVSVLMFSIMGVYMYRYTLKITGTDLITKTLVYRDSYRIDIYAQVLASYKQNVIIKQLFGAGFMSTVSTNFMGYVAHNDFIEMLYDYGLVGLSLLLIWLIKTYKDLKLSDYYLKHTSIIQASYIVTILMCITNTIFYNFGAVIYMLMFWGFIITRKNGISAAKNAIT